MSPQEVQEQLKLNQLKDKIWYVVPSCATTGEGLFEGLVSDDEGCQRLVTLFANGILGMAFQQCKDATSASRPIGPNLQSPKTRLSFLLDKFQIDTTV